MYEKFFFLTEKPFHVTPDPRFLYLSKKHSEAIDLMSFGITGRKGFTMLTGEVGTGKTTLCRALLEKLPKKIESALILNPVLSDHELLQTITGDFGLNVEGSTVKAHLDKLNEFLLKKATEGGGAVVIIDEAQNLSPKTLEMVRLLSNLETEKEKLLQIILVGQPELKEKLGLPELRQLNQRIIIRYHLDPLDYSETDAYIKNRLKIAGGADTVSFPSDSIIEVYKRSCGIPRMINIICDRALTAAFVDSKRVIDLKIMRKALDELEGDGYIRPKKMSPIPAYARYTPHIALSAFLIALLAGILLGPLVLSLAAGTIGAN